MKIHMSTTEHFVLYAYTHKVRGRGGGHVAAESLLHSSGNVETSITQSENWSILTHHNANHCLCGCLAWESVKALCPITFGHSCPRTSVTALCMIYDTLLHRDRSKDCVATLWANLCSIYGYCWLKLNDWIAWQCVHCLDRLTGCPPGTQLRYDCVLSHVHKPKYGKLFTECNSSSVDLLYQTQSWNGSAAVGAAGPSPWCNSPRPLWSLQNLVFLWRLVCSVAPGSWFLGPPTQTQQTPGGGEGVRQGDKGREEAACQYTGANHTRWSHTRQKGEWYQEYTLSGTKHIGTTTCTKGVLLWKWMQSKHTGHGRELSLKTNQHKIPPNETSTAYTCMVHAPLPDSHRTTPSYHVLVAREETDQPIWNNSWELQQQVAIVTNDSYMWKWFA